MATMNSGPIDLDKVVNHLKTLGVKFQSDTNPRGYPACNFVNGSSDEGSIRRLFCTQPDQLPHRIVYLEAPDGVKVVEKGKRNGPHITWASIIAGDATLNENLNMSVDATRQNR